jgi:RNA polymerase sigma factor (sigma-70 family)
MTDTNGFQISDASLEVKQKYNSHTREFLIKVEVLCSNNLHGESIYKFISNRIKELNLHGTDFRDVISEATVRGIEYITRTGNSIQNPKAWMRVTTGNILLEEVRKITRSYQLSDDFLAVYDSSVEFDYFNEEEGESLGENPTRALRAFHHLSRSERRIIIYKLFQGKSYREISNISAYQNDKEVAIRQQYSRAIKKLRASFNEL